ncbi:hypothetical protein DdX_17370 [Ditylenchus destructor]|uniref:Uncharacterized protein n=1 Tax=Ditylenchus destructor TaxID=166010 RepID=A0AAD4MN39_9BILA|nr:hypothetical protein DdX_17370 [Ditylenchus destructor]
MTSMSSLGGRSDVVKFMQLCNFTNSEMNIILCVVAASIVVSLIKSEETVEEKNSTKGKLESIKEKLLEVIKTLGTIQNEVKSSDKFCGYVEQALEYAGVLSESLDAALKVQEKDVNFEELSTYAIVLISVTSNMNSYAQETYAKHPKNAKKLQYSVYLTAMNIKKVIQAIEAHSKQN